MLIIWENGGTNLIRIADRGEWHLYADMDEFGHPMLCLATGSKTYVIAEGSEILQGREKMHLDGYHVLELYSDTIREVAEMLSSGQTLMLDLGEIENRLLRDRWWPKWVGAKLVSDASDEVHFMNT